MSFCCQPGAIDKFSGDTKQILETVAADTEKKGMFEDSIKLYDLAQVTTALWYSLPLTCHFLTCCWECLPIDLKRPGYNHVWGIADSSWYPPHIFKLSMWGIKTYKSLAEAIEDMVLTIQVIVGWIPFLCWCASLLEPREDIVVTEPVTQPSYSWAGGSIIHQR